MSLFISNENQNLLYEMINKAPEIQSVFSTVDEKNRWFREIIEQFFRKLPPTINRDVLKQVNRATLGYMVNNLKSLMLSEIQQPQQQQPQSQQSQQQPYRPIKKEQTLEPKEYTTFFDLPKPKIIDFSEKLDDDVITNMDELIAEQKRMRERELQEYTVLNPPPSTNTDSLQSQQPIHRQTQSIKINILEDLPKANIHEKHVQFSIPSLEVPSLEDKINTIEKKIDKLMDMFQKIQSHNDSQKTPNPDVNIIDFSI